MAIRKVWNCFGEDGSSICPELPGDILEEQDVIEHLEVNPTHVVIETWKEVG